MTVAEIHPGSGVFQSDVVCIVCVHVGKQLLQFPQSMGTTVVRQLPRLIPGMITFQQRPEGLEGRTDHFLIEGLFLLQLTGNRVDERAQTF